MSFPHSVQENLFEKGYLQEWWDTHTHANTQNMIFIMYSCCFYSHYLVKQPRPYLGMAGLHNMVHSTEILWAPWLFLRICMQAFTITSVVGQIFKSAVGAYWLMGNRALSLDDKLFCIRGPAFRAEYSRTAEEPDYLNPAACLTLLPRALLKQHSRAGSASHQHLPSFVQFVLWLRWKGKIKI